MNKKINELLDLEKIQGPDNFTVTISPQGVDADEQGGELWETATLMPANLLMGGLLANAFICKKYFILGLCNAQRFEN